MGELDSVCAGSTYDLDLAYFDNIRDVWQTEQGQQEVPGHSSTLSTLGGNNSVSGWPHYVGSSSIPSTLNISETPNDIADTFGSVVGLQEASSAL